MSFVFVGLHEKPYEKVKLQTHDGDTVREVLWGDFLTVDDSKPADDKWVYVVWAPKTDKLKLKINKKHVLDRRPLEIIFVDVGIGDGAVLITPERDDKERIIVIDAGKGPYMRQFLQDRFKAYGDGFNFHAAIITHPDLDHYKGFQQIFSRPKIKFDHVYHSGLVERPVKDLWAKLGTIEQDPDGSEWLVDLPQDDAAMRAAFSGDPKTFSYPKLIRAGIDNGNVAEFRMLSTKHGTQEDGKTYVPGFAPADNADYHIRILGPWVEMAAPNKPRLKLFGTSSDKPGVTKNGHSIILRLRYRNFSVLFGGDLNRPAEKYLLMKHTGTAAWPTTPDERAQLIAAAAPTFSSDVMKTCHHGSSDVTDEFLQAVAPGAYVISSGDEDGDYVHPRPDLLGRLGRRGDGPAPVLLSTELQRSTRAEEDRAMVLRLKRNVAAMAAMIPPPATGPNPADALAESIAKDIAALGLPNISVDGAIYLKTDGHRMIVAFKKEGKDPKSKWFWYEYTLDQGKLQLVPRPDEH